MSGNAPARRRARRARARRHAVARAGLAAEHRVRYALSAHSRIAGLRGNSQVLGAKNVNVFFAGGSLHAEDYPVLRRRVLRLEAPALAPEFHVFASLAG